MDDARRDAWTRRRFGFVVGGGLAFPLILAAIDEALVRKKRKRKRKKQCRKRLQSCGGKKTCCKGLTCGDTSTSENVCCKPVQGTCMAPTDCCGDQGCAPVSGLSGPRCCHGFFAPCTEYQDCCSPFTCLFGHCDI